MKVKRRHVQGFTVKIKRRHVQKTLRVVQRTAKRVPVSTLAPVALDVATELLPGSKAAKIAIIIGKAALKK